MKKLLTLLSLLVSSVIVSAQLSPIQMGRSSNVYSIVLEEQNQVFANDSLNTVLFIHRQDVSLYGAPASDNGKLRFDISTNGGNSFANDVGILNSTYTRPARYPQITMYNPSTTTNPSNAKIIWTAPTLNSIPTWDGNVNGTFSTTSASPPASSENYQYFGQRAYISGGLCQGMPGEFWTAEFGYNGTLVTDSLYLYKGVYNTSTQDVDWSRYLSIDVNFYTGFDGNSRKTGPNVAFSPDGTKGWIAFLGDLTGGADTTYNPVFMRSQNGGTNWSVPQELDLQNFSWLSDSLQTLWIAGIDALGKEVPTSTGRPTTSFDFDLTVDANGNPHMFTIIASASTQNTSYAITGGPSYSVYPALAKFACDITTPNGGQTWVPEYIAPILRFRGTFGVGTTITQDNRPQIARSEDGTLLFYSWVDTDTSGGNFGGNVNNNPNLYSCAKRISDGFRTCYRGVTLGDPSWNGDALFPTVSPTVLQNGSSWQVPTVMAEMLSNNPLQSTQFWYFGNEIQWHNLNFLDPDSLNLAWTDNGNCNNCLFPANISASSLACNGDTNGTATIMVSGGAGAFGYSWSNGSTANNLTGLSGGSYDVTVSDDAGCNVMFTATINEPPPLAATVSATDPLCNGGTGSISVSPTGGMPPFSYAWSNGSTNQNLSNVFAGNYTVTVTDAGGCSGIIPVTLNQPSAIQANATANNPLCNGGMGDIILTASGGTSPLSYSWSNGASSQNLNGIAPGSYTVTISDANGCQEVVQATLVEPTLIEANGIVTDALCNGSTGGISTAPGGGTGSLAFIWSDGSTSQTIGGVFAGTYTLTIIDGNACTETFTYTVNEPPAISLSISSTDETTAGANDGTATAMASGGTPGFTYSWSNGATTASISGLTPGTYTLTILDANACVATETVTIMAGTVSIDDELAMGLEAFEVFPNPNKGSFQLLIELNEPQALEIDIFDLNGKKIYSTSTPKIRIFSKQLSLRTLAAGAYVLRVSSASGSAVKRILVE